MSSCDNSESDNLHTQFRLLYIRKIFILNTRHFFYRGNSRGYDLNRNFPDYFKANTKRTQPETDAVKDWISKIQFLISGSLHGGALVSFSPQKFIIT